MVYSKESKNFFQEHLHYFFLGVSIVIVLSVGVYYINSNYQDHYHDVINHQKEKLKEKKHIKEENNKNQKTEKVVLDPVIDNIYWSIASFIVYYLVYLGIRYTNYKDRAAWFIVLSIFLWKIGLAAFSNYYYQVSNFDQNLEKSFHPIYFIHQNIYQIVLSLTGYLGLAALIYFDREKPGQQPGGQLPEGQQPVGGGLPPAGLQPRIIPNEPEIPINQNINNNNINQNQINRQKMADRFKETINFNLGIIKSTQLNEAKKIDDLLKKPIFFHYDRINYFINGVKCSILEGKITEAGIEKLISRGFNDQSPKLNENFFRKNIYEEACFNSFFGCMLFFVKSDQMRDEMIQIFLDLINNEENRTDDARIESSKKFINEFFYFTSCVINLQQIFFNKIIFRLEDMSPFRNDVGVRNNHLYFIQHLIKECNLENLFNYQNNDLTVDNCQDIEKLYEFLINNRNSPGFKVDENGFINLLEHMISRNERYLYPLHP